MLSFDKFINFFNSNCFNKFYGKIVKFFVIKIQDNPFKLECYNFHLLNDLESKRE